MTVNSLEVGSLLSPHRRVYAVSEIDGGWRHLTIENTTDGVCYTTYLHEDISLADAFGGGRYSPGDDSPQLSN